MPYKLNGGIVPKPVRCLIYGPEGIGKTTFVADLLRLRGGALIDTEQGSGRIDVTRYPVPATWLDLLAMVKDAATNHEVGALGIDTMDAAERMCATYMLETKGWKSLEDPGYGAGYRMLWEEYQKLTKALDDVYAAGKDIILASHAAMRKFEQPDQMGSYDRWELKLQNSQKCSISALVKEKVDMVLFANYETIVVTAPDKKTKKASGGKRIVYSTHHPCWDAKNRYGLPEEMPLDFAAFKPYLYPDAQEQKTIPETVPETVPEEPKKTRTKQKPQGEVKVESAPPQGAAAPEVHPKPTVLDPVTPEELAGLPDKLADLMVRDGIHMYELAAWSVKEGYFANNIPFTRYDPDYLSEYLPSVWDKRIVPEVTAIRETMPF